MALARPTVERIQLGLTLSRLRTDARKSQGEAAAVISRTAGRLSQVENGRGGLGPEELLRLLDFYGVRGEERQTVLALGVASRKRSPRRGYVDNLPEPFKRVVDMQASAARISWYECGIIPGLVQSPDYVRTIMALGNGIYWDTSEEETEERIAFRLEHHRRVLETGEPKQLAVIFTEDSLHHPIGGTSVMRGQVLHMLQLMERHPLLDIRIVPTTTVDNPALGGGEVLLDFSGSSTIGFVSVLHGPATYYDQLQDIEPMQRLFQRVEELALSRDDSQALLADLVKEGL
ncbi:helix-turn-helix transcriptional regulator [Saccharothrix violaceirubra]|uniref:HTH cro/C1-type domain-containing protein n=1 Tax=Saccharothrix violaceirubra TaxID=413306 RepID=A0A7W7TA65_9PSEU|nr:helix-turn-helix transcriptional regulator [Saccharothrix violaceirubra]MBB4969389.1 hypothetical protein [Saccharothrix violaceirubra]